MFIHKHPYIPTDIHTGRKKKYNKIIDAFTGNVIEFLKCYHHILDEIKNSRI